MNELEKDYIFIALSIVIGVCSVAFFTSEIQLLKGKEQLYMIIMNLGIFIFLSFVFLMISVIAKSKMFKKKIIIVNESKKSKYKKR